MIEHLAINFLAQLLNIRYAYLDNDFKKMCGLADDLHAKTGCEFWHINEAFSLACEKLGLDESEFVTPQPKKKARSALAHAPGRRNHQAADYHIDRLMDKHWGEHEKYL